jgi:hypothetical protein
MLDENHQSVELKSIGEKCRVTIGWLRCLLDSRAVREQSRIPRDTVDKVSTTDPKMYTDEFAARTPEKHRTTSQTTTQPLSQRNGTLARPVTR